MGPPPCRGLLECRIRVIYSNSMSPFSWGPAFCRHVADELLKGMEQLLLRRAEKVAQAWGAPRARKSAARVGR